MKITTKLLLLSMFSLYSVAFSSITWAVNPSSAFNATSAISVTDTIKPINLNTIVVTANKTKVNRNNVPLTISVIDKAEIEAASSSSVLPVLSQLVPGLFVTQKGMLGFGVSEGSAGAINIRGVGQGNKVLMLFDGQPQWAGVFGHSIPDLYLSSDIERVEVIRGPGSLMYGSNAMGGVVNVITRNNLEDGNSGRARVSYGSYNTARFMINNSFNSGKFSSFVSLNHDRTDGHRDNSSFNITNGLAKVGYRLNNYLDVNGHLSLSKIYNENPGQVKNLLTDNKMDIFRKSASLALENRHSYGSGAIRGFFNSGDHVINDGYTFNSAPKSYLFNSIDHNYGVLAYENFTLLPGNSFTVGFDYKNWGGKAWNETIETSQKTQLADRKTYETAGYLIAQQEFFDKLTLNVGLRFEYNSTFGEAWVPQIGTALRLFKGNVIKGSISKGYRSPTIREMYMFPPQNPYLLPENMINYEISVGQMFLDSRLSTEMNLFLIDGWNMIEVIRINGVPKNLNTGYFNNKGVELQASYKIKPELRADFNYSFLKTSKPMLAAPAHKLFFGVGYSYGKLFLNANMQYVGDMYVNTATKEMESFTVINLHAAYRLTVMGIETRIFINGDNITGSSYSINEGFPMPGATVIAGIDIRF